MTLFATPHGEARLTRHDGYDETATTAAVILHGAGTDTGVPLLVGLADVLADNGVATWRLDQPYTLGSRRPPAPAAQLDTVAAAVIGPLVQGRRLFLIGRSSGSRVACRTAKTLGVAGVVALGFPLHPPGRPGVSRAGELEAAGVPVTVLQGTRDGFGTAHDLAALGLGHVTVQPIAGADHGFDVRRRDGRTQQEIRAQVHAAVLAVVLPRA